MRAYNHVVVVLAVCITFTKPTALAGDTAYYPFSEGSGTTTSDASGAGHTGTLNGGVTWSTDTPTGGGPYALSYNGTDSSVTTPHAADLMPQQSLVIEADFKASAFPTNSGHAAIVGKGGWDAGSGYELTVSWDGKIELLMYIGGTTYPNNNIFLSSAITTGRWYHVRGEYDGTKMSLSLDGTLIASTTQSLGGTTISGAITANTNSLYIGRRDPANNFASYFNGLIDNVRLSSTGTTNSAPVITSSPIANPNRVLVNQAVQFSATAQDPDGDTVNYSWDFGDGTFGTGASTTHGYPINGIFTVQLTVTDGKGGTAAAETTVTVSAGAGVAVSPPTQTGEKSDAPATVYFDPNSGARADGTYTISGYLLNSTGEGIPGAKWQATDPLGTPPGKKVLVRKDVTDSSGHFIISGNNQSGRNYAVVSFSFKTSSGSFSVEFGLHTGGPAAGNIVLRSIFLPVGGQQLTDETKANLIALGYLQMADSNETKRLRPLVLNAHAAIDWLYVKAFLDNVDPFAAGVGAGKLVVAGAFAAGGAAQPAVVFLASAGKDLGLEALAAVIKTYIDNMPNLTQAERDQLKLNVSAGKFVVGVAIGDPIAGSAALKKFDSFRKAAKELSTVTKLLGAGKIGLNALQVVRDATGKPLGVTTTVPKGYTIFVGTQSR